MIGRPRGKTSAEENISAELKICAFPPLNGEKTADAGPFTKRNGFIEIKKEGHEIIHILIKRGCKLGSSSTQSPIQLFEI